MAKKSLTQEVQLFSDENTKGTQEVHIDTEDECGVWLSVIHDGNELNLSLENWDKLTQLVDKAKKILNLE